MIQQDEESIPLSNGHTGQQYTRHTTPARMPCKRSAPTGMTPRKKHAEGELGKPQAYKHFKQRGKKHAMAQVGFVLAVL